MSWIKKIFELKEKEEIKQEEVVAEVPKEDWKECFYCKEMITKEDRWAKQQGKYFHKKCYKEMIRSFK
jgi:hypothetical protein